MHHELTSYYLFLFCFVLLQVIPTRMHHPEAIHQHWAVALLLIPAQVQLCPLNPTNPATLCLLQWTANPQEQRSHQELPLIIVANFSQPSSILHPSIHPSIWSNSVVQMSIQTPVAASFPSSCWPSCDLYNLSGSPDGHPPACP